MQKRDARGRFASGGGGSAGGGGGGKKGPKTAAGRASANERAAEKARMANPRDKKAANKLITAKAAKEYYKDTGTGRKGAAKPAKKAAPAKAAPAKAANKVAASPRRLSGDEQKVAKIMGDKSLRSDRQRLAAAQKAGVKGDFGATYAKVKQKLGNPGSKTTDVATARKEISSALKKAAPSAPKATAAQKKKALIRDASSKVLAGKGKEVGAARRGYIRAQQEESLRMEKTGKGSKAKRRMAKK